MLKRYSKIKAILIFLLAAILLGSPIFSAYALDFNPNFVLTDNELLDYNSMTREEIQKFLESRRGFLAYYVAVDTDGLIKTAADIIWRASQEFRLNPKFLLAMLQKEQNLIDNPRFNQKQYDWAMGFGACDRCLLKHPLVNQYKGFANQLYYAAKRIRTIYLDDLEKSGKTYTGFGPGIRTRVDKRYYVEPVNIATAVVYTYTPHIKGNKILWKILTGWSQRRYPNGSLLQDEKAGGIWLIQNGKKRPFLSKTAFASRFYDTKKVIPVSKDALEIYETSAPIQFPDWSLLRTPDKKICLTIGDICKEFASYDVFRNIGYNPEEIIEVGFEDIETYAKGPPITLESVFPLGALLQDKQTGGIYYVEDGKKFPIWSKELLKTNFSTRKIIKVSSEELEKYQVAEPIIFPDGELIKTDSSPTVYYIENGKLRPISSAEIFEALGWKWKNVIQTSSKILELHSVGEPLTLASVNPDSRDATEMTGSQILDNNQ